MIAARRALLLLLVACPACRDDADVLACPGDAVVALELAAGGAIPAPPLLPGEEALPACPEVPADLAFRARVALTGEATAALCTDRPFAAIATGTRAGDAIDVATSTNRAVLTQCGEGCVVEVRERLAGTLLPSAGAPERFTGALVDTVRPAAASSLCGDCALPCAARYGIEGVVPAPPSGSPAVAPLTF